MNAAARLRHREDLRFVFAGTGIQQERIQQRLAQGDLDHTVWTGWLSHDQMPLAWAAADLSAWAVADNVLNRLSFQSKLYEAFASGTPLAVAVEGLMANTITENNAGIAVPFGDSEALATAIERILNDSSCASKCGRMPAPTRRQILMRSGWRTLMRSCCGRSVVHRSEELECHIIPIEFLRASITVLNQMLSDYILCHKVIYRISNRLAAGRIEE